MSTINVQCIDQSMQITNAPVIAAGGRNEDNIQFAFSQEWEGYVKVCAFWQEPGLLWYSLIDENDSCVVPHEAMSKNGKICFGVVGAKGNVTRTSEVLRYNLAEGVVTEAENPTPSIYEQILSKLAAADQALEDVQTLSELVEQEIESQNARIDQMGVGALDERVTSLETAVEGSVTSFTLTLTTAGWSNLTQVVSNSAIVANEYFYIVTPSPSSFENYGKAGIYALDVTTDGQITFACKTVPTVEITVSVMKVRENNV